MTTARLQREDGAALVTAVVLMAVMLGLALATLALSDTGGQRALEQRQRDSSLNLAEGVLQSQGFALAVNWPGSAGAQTMVPASCDHTSVSNLCPTPSTLAAAQNTANPAAANFSNLDVSSRVTWTARIRDNGGPLAGAYTRASADLPQSGTNLVTGQSYSCPAMCRWDANGDRQLWVEARTEVKNRPRDVVALLKLEQVLEATPQTAVTAGGINIGNNGNKIMIFANGSQVVVRCNVSASNCAMYQNGQIQPAPTTADAPPLMTAAQLARFKQRAITDGRYFAGCPDDDISGAVVWVENCSSGTLNNSIATQPCNPAAPPQPGGGGNGLAQSCVNQYSRPGILIWHCGSMRMTGQWTYVGLIYAVNDSDGTCPGGPRGNGNCNVNVNDNANVVSMTGGFGVWGVLAIDGKGCLYAGSNAIQVQYDPNVFQAVASYGTVGLVQNTWRELPPGV